jgi:hypothetical protein
MPFPTPPSTLSSTLWVVAAPFRYHVRHLVSTTGVPWQAIAVVAGLPQQQVRTLLYGRGGHLRPRLSPYAARRLLAVDESRLRRLQVRDLPVPVPAARARELLDDGLPLVELADWLHLDVHSTTRLAEGVGQCSRVTDIMLRLACIEHGLLMEREAREVA